MPTSITLDESTRNELRRYKAEYGYTYDEAIDRLLQESGHDDRQ